MSQHAIVIQLDHQVEHATIHRVNVRAKMGLRDSRVIDVPEDINRQIHQSLHVSVSYTHVSHLTFE